MLKKFCVACIIFAMALCFSTSVLAQVQTHGFLLFRTIAAHDNYTSRVERYGIRFTEKVDDEFDWLTEIYIHPQQPAGQGRLYMESAFLNWNLSKRLPWDFKIRIGKGRNYCYGQTPSYGRRRTTDYSLYSEAFTQLRVLGLQTFSNFGPVQLAVAIINPYSMASRRLPDFPIGLNIPIPICDRDTDNSTFNRIALSGRLGYQKDMLNVGVNVYASDPREGTAGAKSRYGVDAEVKLESGFLVQVQGTVAQTAIDYDQNGSIDDLDHMGAEVLGGWEKDKIGLYARYGMVTYDDKLQDLNSVMLSAVYKIRPRIHFRLEGIVNGEDKDMGMGEVDNNVILFETLFAW